MAESENSEISMDRTQVFVLDQRVGNRLVIRSDFSGSEDTTKMHILAGSDQAVEVQGEFAQRFNACDVSLSDKVP